LRKGEKSFTLYMKKMLFLEHKKKNVYNFKKKQKSIFNLNNYLRPLKHSNKFFEFCHIK